MPAPLVLRIITDITQTLKATSAASSSMTGVGKAALNMGADIQKATMTAVTNGVRMEEQLKAEAAAYRQLATSAKLTAAEQVKAAQYAEAADAKLARAQGLVVTGTRAVSSGAKTAERDLGKLTRGALAGSGVISALGRSLAFASGGFIAVAGTATLLHNAITEALGFAATEKQVTAQLKTSGLSFEEYKTQIEDSLNAESKLSGFTRGELLQSFGYLVRVSGDVGQSLKLNAVAADVARGRHISLSAASIALAKALGGSSTALRRLGIIVPKTAVGMAAIEFVAKKFAGQAESGATSADHLRASFANAGEVIGTVLLPTFNRLTTEFSDWLTKMQASGKLQKDASEAFTILGYVFHSLGAAIKFVDDVTGGFRNTLVLLIGLELGSKILSWSKALIILAGEWGLVGKAATEAGLAQSAALAESGAAGTTAAGAVGARALLGGAVSGGLLGAGISRLRYGRAAGSAARVGAFTDTGGGAMLFTGEAGAGAAAGEAGLAAGASATGVGALAVAALLATDALAGLAKSISHAAGGGSTGDKIIGGVEGVLTGGLFGQHNAGVLGQLLHPDSAFRRFLSPPKPPPVNLVTPSQFGLDTMSLFGPKPGAFGVQPMQQYWKQWSEGFKLQNEELQAALTKSNTDDVAVAKAIIAKIKKQLDEGLLHGPAYAQALQALASALGIVWQAATDAAQKAAAKAAAAKQKIITQIQNAINPLNLQVELARTESLGQNIIPVLKKQLAAAYRGLTKAIAANNKDLELQAYQQITSLKQQIKDAMTSAGQTFTEPMKLQIALARAEAFGGDTTSVLKKMKAAALRALKSGKYSGQALIDLLNEIANINSQLGSATTNAYGDYKKASVKKLTEGIGLTADQRRRLEARLAQRGPGGTVPETGTGAAGYIIDPDTGRPVRRGHHRRRGSGSYSTSTGGGGAPIIHADINLTVNIDGKQVEATVTKQQQRRRRHNPTQTRGPNAATSNA